MASSPIFSEVDFDAHGKHHGYLRVPHSVHRSAYGWIPVPVTVIQNGDGPTLVVTAGVHGDEYEGQIAVSFLARELGAEDIRGRLILLPMLNFPAAEAGLRVSPIDDGNLNRLFPGNPHGAPSEMLAHWYEHVLMPMSDYAVDLHSGGASLEYPATLLRGPAHSPEEAAGLTMLQDAFDLPYTWVFTGGGGRESTARTAMGAANRNGVINVMAELGGGACVTPDILRRTTRGLNRVLHALGMLPGYRPDAQQGTRVLNACGSVYAYGPGVFEPLKDIGEDVREGSVLALIHQPDTPGAAPAQVTSQYSGIVLARRALAHVCRGDALFQIASDAT